MGYLAKNTRYFLSEVQTIVRLNGISSMLSAMSLVMIYFIALLAISGWWLSADLVNALKSEAEISVYYTSHETMNSSELMAHISDMEGVRAVIPVSAEEAYHQMVEILGDEADVLAHFSENPFDPYLAVEIEIDRNQDILKALNELDGVDYIRDNQTALEKIQQVTDLIRIAGIFIVIAVVVTTFIITSHIIREGIHSHHDQITTLELLGAPDWFIGFPFVFEGLILTAFASMVAILLFHFFIGRMGVQALDSFSFLSSFTLSWNKHLLYGGLLAANLIMGLIACLFGLQKAVGKP